MNRLLIDTNIFIDHFRGYKPAATFLVKIFNGDYNPLISTLTEMLSQHRRQDLTSVDALIAASAISTDAILVTRNVKHFSLVDNLLTLQPY